MGDFNSYIKGIDRSFIKELCISKGRAVSYKKNESFARKGITTSYMGYIKRGYFKYIIQNQTEGKEYIVGFVFEDEFVADYPSCLYDLPANVTIKAAVSCEVYLLEGREFRTILEQNGESRLAYPLAEHLFLQTYRRYLNMYAYTPEERYRELLKHCPEVFQTLTLKEIASYLKVTPATISNIRRKITFGK